MPDTSTRAHSRLAFPTPGVVRHDRPNPLGQARQPRVMLLELAEAKRDEDFQSCVHPEMVPNAASSPASAQA